MSDFYVGDRATSFSEFPEYKEYTRVSLYYDSETLKATVGNDTGREMVLVSPFFPISTSACETLAQNILNELSGFNYRPFKATGAELDPSADLGDTLTICGIESFIGQLDTTFNQAFISDINTPSGDDIDHEYQYQSQVERDLNRKVEQGKFYHGVSITRENGVVVQKTNGDEIAGEAIFNSDVLAMRAVIDGVMKDCIYFDTASQKYRLSGDVLIDGSVQSDAVVTDALYAEQGDIAQLTVDWIDTSKRVQKYLNKDTSSDFHFVGHDTTIEFIRSDVIMSGSTPQTEQMQNRYGNLLYWQKDISNAEIVDGYPYVENLRVYITEEDTGFPVMVYQYNNHVMRQISFQQDPESGNWFPTDLYGMGVDEQGLNGRGKILKTTGGFELTYTTTAGVVTGVYMRDDGFVDTVHRRADITVDTVNKQFVISPEGVLADTFTINYTENGNTLSLTWPDGKTFKVVKN